MMPVVVFATVKDVSLSSQTVGLGEVVKLVIITSSPIETSHLNVFNRSYKLFFQSQEDHEFRYVSYLAASRLLVSRDHILKVKVRCKNHSFFYEQYKLVLDYPKVPKKGKVLLTDKAKTLASDKQAYSNEGSLLNKLFSTLTEKQYFTGPFMIPARGRLSSGFAYLRTYNNGKVSSHSGIDISNQSGTPVVASAMGTVLFSDTLKIHGNTIVIDHGVGILSVYCHLKRRLCKKGDRLPKGYLIGEMGMTGVSSGVHLHWGVSVQNIRVNPIFLTHSGFNSKEV